MYVFSTLVLIVLTILITRFVKKQRYAKKCLDNFPGPPKSLFFGCAGDFMRDRGMLDVFREYQKKYGDVVSFRIGPHIHSLLFTSADFAKTIFLSNTNLTKGEAYDYIKCWLGEGLLTTTEAKWKTQRKMLMPAFNNQLLADFVYIFDHQAEVLLGKIKSIVPTNSVNIQPLISLCSLDIICETSMGVSLHAQENKNTEYVDSVKGMCNIVATRSCSLWKALTLLFVFTEDYKKQRKCLKILNSYTDKVISDKKKQRLQRVNSEENSHSKGERRKLALLDILLDYSENEKVLSEQEIRQEVHTFMFAGHDTVTTAMSFCLFEIAQHPDVQRMIYEEQKTIFGKDIGRETTPQDIHEMKYLEMVIKESMRLYPPVPVYTRTVETEFIYDGKVIPKGVFICHFSYGLHRNEKYFPNPDVFDPSRFEDELITPLSFLPFSAGPRNCIGQKFAMYEMKVILSKLLRNFEFWPAEPQHILDIRAEVVLVSRTGINVKITPR